MSVWCKEAFFFFVWTPIVRIKTSENTNCIIRTFRQALKNTRCTFTPVHHSPVNTCARTSLQWTRVLWPLNVVTLRSRVFSSRTPCRRCHFYKTELVIVGNAWGCTNFLLNVWQDWTPLFMDLLWAHVRYTWNCSRNWSWTCSELKSDTLRSTHRNVHGPAVSSGQIHLELLTELFKDQQWA